MPDTPRPERPDLDAITREADARRAVWDTVFRAAGPLFVDGRDAVDAVDLSTVVDDDGAPDGAKIMAALDQLLTARPHLARDLSGLGDAGRAAQRQAAVDHAAPLEDRVKSVLATMQATS